MTNRRRSPERSADKPAGTADEPAQDLPSLEIVLAVAAIAAVVAAFAGAAPTGTTGWDPALTGAMAAAFTLATSQCPRRFLAVVATAAAAFVGWSLWLVVAFAGVVVAVVSELLDGPRRMTGAVVGALTVQAFLRIEPIGFFGLPSILAGIALVAVIAVGYANAPLRAQKAFAISAAVAMVAAVAALAVGSLVILSARAPAERGIAAARGALTAARSGDAGAVSASLTTASTDLGTVESRLDHPLTTPLQLVPVVAQHQRALKVAVQQGSALASQASGMVSEQDVADLRFQQGSFDLDALQELAPQLQRTAAQLNGASRAVDQARTPWLLPTVDRRVQELLDEVDAVLPEAQLSADAAGVLPQMLGKGAPRRYLMLVGSPGETRQLGGFVGGYALIELRDGNASLIESGRAPELATLAPGAALDHPDGYPTELLDADPVTYPQNLTTTPSLHTVARAARDLYPLLVGAPIDGVIYLDPYTIGAITELTGPLMIEGRTEPLTKENSPDFFFKEQYTIYDSRSDSFGAIELALEAAVRGLAGADLPGPEELGRVLGPSARSGRLQVVTFDDDENRFLQAAKLQRVFIAPQVGDSVALVQANASASKLDAFLQREVRYTTDVSADGDVQATLDITLTSSIPLDAPEYTLGGPDEVPGLNKVLLTVYSPHQVSAVTVRGQPHEVISEREFGFWRHSLFIVPVPANEQARVLVELAGTIDLETDYVLHVWQQPLVNDDLWQVETRIEGKNGWSQSEILVENTTFSAPS